MSTERLIVDEKVADAFVKKLKIKASTLKASDPRNGKTPLGRGSRPRRPIKPLIEDALGKGALVVAGGKIDGRLCRRP